MEQPVVFIASSTEGFEVAKVVRSHLVKELRDQAKVTPWTRAFDLSATYIESLERVAREADWAVLVLTADDVVFSRDKKKVAPRDNVLFELGLFMGSLGRARCLIVDECRSDLKLPTDLLGVHRASFSRQPGQRLEDALDATCLLIAERIAELGPRYKMSAATQDAQLAARRWAASIEGAWWERVYSHEDSSALSFFRIDFEEPSGSVVLAGRSYNQDGAQAAQWKSVLTRVEPEERRLLYHWRGWHSDPSTANVPFHGFGEIDFDAPANQSDVMCRGSGKFWNVDEAHPDRTLVKTIEVRRIEDAKVLGTMLGGNAKAVQTLIKHTLNQW
jgi:Predicted nucleotide-binding protein containing TIR-like domain